MPEQLLVRKVPRRIRDWIDIEKQRSGLTQNQLLLSVLHSAANGEPAPTLFDLIAAPRATVTGSEALPFTFVDLFAGIGGFRIALQRVGGTSVFSCEWDKHCQKTLKAWFGETPHEDIRKIKPSEIPDHDVLAAGFPCQPFSIAGVSKKNSLGHAHGFKCATQGTLFYNLATIIEYKRPPIVLLENVKNLLSHDKGRTWKVISSTLNDLKYKVFCKVIDAANYVPQHRERVFIVCFDRKVFGDDLLFEFPKPPPTSIKPLADILETAVSEKYTLSDHLWKYLQEYAKRHKAKGNGFGFGIADVDGVTRTLSARYYKDGSEILIPQPDKNPRRLTPRECARLMGFPDELPIVVSDTQAYRQFGNALVPAVAEAVAKEVVKVLFSHLRRSGNGCLIKRR
jgi:DNA (cytosine-5)-methyltransferase 1